MYGKGIDQYGCLFDVALDKGILSQKGAWVQYNGESFAQGRDNAIEKLKTMPELVEKIKNS
jgi:recombination protein RecA